MTCVTKLTPEVQQTICETLAGGNFLTTAAACAGVANSTLHDWLRRGARAAKGDEEYVEFREAVRKAQAMKERDLVARVHAVDPKWILERAFPKHWGRKDHFSELDREIQQLRRRVAKINSRVRPEALP